MPLAFLRFPLLFFIFALSNTLLVSPDGKLQRYNPKNGEITLISMNMPSDLTDPYRINNNGSNERNPIDAIDNMKYLYNIYKRISLFKIYNLFH